VPKVPNAKDIKYFTEDDGRVFMHPTAVNFTTQTYASPWLAYLSKIQTSKVYVRDATVISAYALLLFGGEIEVDRENGFIVIGSWIKFVFTFCIQFYSDELCVNNILCLCFISDFMPI
jgi:ATP-dependent RNA helicase DHX57